MTLSKKKWCSHFPNDIIKIERINFMNDKELWQEFIQKKNITNHSYEAWSFGSDADLLANLVFTGEKTATSSPYPLYPKENVPLPKAGQYHVILNSKNQAVCIIQTTKVYISPFHKITSFHAYKEGDKSLQFWKKTHEDFFTTCLKDADMTFTFDMDVVCEEFEVVYRPK